MQGIRRNFVYVVIWLIPTINFRVKSGCQGEKLLQKSMGFFNKSPFIFVLIFQFALVGALQ